MKCSICIDNIDSDLFTTNCEHIFHLQCIKTHIQYSENNVKCPICRTIIYKKLNNSRESSSTELDIINDAIIRLENTEPNYSKCYFMICKYMIILGGILLYFYFLITK